VKPRPEGAASKLEPEISSTLDSFGYELVQLKLGGRVGSQTLTVIFDKPGGVTSADCTYMASRLSVLLDVLDPVQGHYTLVVSSPGVNRPLTKDADFERFAGSRVALKWGPADANSRTLRGKILGVAEGAVQLTLEGGTEQTVPLSEVEAANILYDWEQDDDANPQG
jgi:ribosome maturation factor RimP